MALHTFNCEDQVLNMEFFNKYGKADVVDSWNTVEFKNPRVLVKNKYKANTGGNEKSPAKKRLVIVPGLVAVYFAEVDILDINGELKVQEKFSKTIYDTVYKGLLYSDNSIYIYRKAVFKINEKDIQH